MIKITYGQLRNPDFLKATQKIHKSKMSMKSAKRVSEILRELQKELEIANEIFVSRLIKDHMLADGEDFYRAKPGIEHMKAIQDFMETPVEIQKARLTSEELFHVELSPLEVELLEGLVEVES